ncbi:MAG: glycerol-3-phosphate 1-O-acyltransferase PlsY [Firmicutes bacterium]|nr:glycerol-3-phosphate 1-O-acyltransferase PlsY [Bacillota bacterium]
MELVIAIIAAYLLGSIPFGLITGKIWANVDVREFGSGNIGMSNVLRTLGPIPALIVLLFDAGKGFFAVTLGRQLFTDPTWWLVLGIVAIAGHNWSIFLGFKGGRGVATTAGVLLAISPFIALVLVGIWLLSLAISRYISLSSIIAVSALPIIFYFLDYPITYFWLGLLISIFTIFRHRPNIQRLMAGTEYKFGEKGQRN